ncbi:MAG: hypothetical protein R3321_00215 [Nitrososphaeraceae archaeon]|nr:hypothetical protein [Nitrososphaeraceae archaeon]
MPPLLPAQLPTQPSLPGDAKAVELKVIVASAVKTIGVILIKLISLKFDILLYVR